VTVAVLAGANSGTSFILTRLDADYERSVVFFAPSIKLFFNTGFGSAI